jgi:cobalt-zinc-cadmium efflux system membrane fusion protein
MKEIINNAALALLIFLVSALTFLWATGNLHIGGAVAGPLAQHDGAHESDLAAPDACGACPEDTHSEGGDDEHQAAESQPDIDAIFSMKCEHDVTSIVDCDECRYEVGVVKVDPSVSEALIKTEVASHQNLSKVLTVTGRIELDQTRLFEVASAGKGRVIRIEKMLGEKVKAGDILAVVHSAELGQAKAEYLETQARLELAQATYTREKGLYEKQIASQADYLKAQSELRSAEACLAADEKKLNLFGMDTEQIAAIDNEKENGHFAQLVLRATADGTVIEQNITVGKLIDTTDSLYTVADLSNLWVWCDLYEKDLAQMHKLLVADTPVKATLRVVAFEDTRFEGIVDLITSKLDTETRTVQMRLQVANTDRMLKPGMFADVSISTGETTLALAVPKTAIMTDEGLTFLFRHLKDDFWVRRDVLTGKENNGYIQIVSGLEENAKVVTKGAFMFKSDVLREKMGAGCAH